MATAANVPVSPEEYLERERKAEFRSEYLCGQIVAMAGGSYEHSVLIANLIGELRQGLRKTACTVSSSDVRLAISSSALYTYADVMVVCGDPVFVDNRRDTVSNPLLIIEVLSESTKGYDRGEKARQYRNVPSLVEYLTVAQDEMCIEQFTRQPESQWLIADHTLPESRILLVSVGLELQLSDVYEKVDLSRSRAR